MFRAHFAAIILLLIGSAVSGHADDRIFIARHAEKQTDGTKDPSLSEAGRARAESLRDRLLNENIRAIYVTEFKRTRETAEPLARALHIEPIVIPAADVPALIAKVKSAAGNVLVIGHSNTIPAMLTALGIGEAVQIPDDQYGTLYVITKGPVFTLTQEAF